MGLDMYAYKARRLSEDEAKKLEGMNINDIPDGIHAFTISKFNDDDIRLVTQLQPYFRTINLDTGFVDMRRIRDDYKVPDTYLAVGQRIANSEYGYTFSSTRKTISVTIPADEFKEKYVVTKIKPTWVVRMQQLAYWRNRYLLSERLAQASPAMIENCGYYACTPLMIKIMNQFDTNIDPDATDIFYKEWY